MHVDELRTMDINRFIDFPFTKEIESVVKAYEKAQTTLYNLAGQNNDDLMKIRMGTVLTVAVLNNVVAGKSVKEFTSEDWCKIANQVVDNAVNVNPSDYTAMIFLTYADYIDVSIKVIENFAPKDMVAKIQLISSDIHEKTDQLKAGELKETEYIESCLWLCLEAMVKLLSTYTSKYFPQEYTRLIDGSVSYAFEYGRLMLYKREQEIITEYIEKQAQLDEQLNSKYQKYLKELKIQTECFDLLIADAFDDDFRERLKGSVNLARAVGVKETDILDSVSKIDDFFE